MSAAGSILVGDCDAGMGEVLVQALAAAGHDCHLRETADGVLEALGRGGFKLAILDSTLPMKSAVEIAKELRGRGDETPIVIMSGSMVSIHSFDDLKLPGVTILTKPYVLANAAAVAERVAAGRPAKPEA